VVLADKAGRDAVLFALAASSVMSTRRSIAEATMQCLKVKAERDLQSQSNYHGWSN